MNFKTFEFNIKLIFWYWAFNVFIDFLCLTLNAQFLNERFYFPLTPSPPFPIYQIKDSCGPITNPQNPPCYPMIIFQKNKNKLRAKSNLESKQIKEKKVCNLYPFSWRNLCFTFESFLLGVNVENHCGLQNRNCNPFLRWRLLWSLWKTASLFIIINDFHFLLYFQG